MQKNRKQKVYAIKCNFELCLSWLHVFLMREAFPNKKKIFCWIKTFTEGKGRFIDTPMIHYSAGDF